MGLFLNKHSLVHLLASGSAKSQFFSKVVISCTPEEWYERAWTFPHIKNFNNIHFNNINNNFDECFQWDIRGRQVATPGQHQRMIMMMEMEMEIRWSVCDN